MPGRRYDIGNLESYKEVQATYNGIETRPVSSAAAPEIAGNH
jgi:hypothetical protein